jgi:replicative DNA helicase
VTKTVKPASDVIDAGAKFLDSEQFSRESYPRGWLIENVLVRGQPGVIGGPKKSLKTSLVIDMAISLGTGKPFLNAFKVPRRVRVAVLSGESGGATVQETARRVCKAKGLKICDCDILWSFDLPRLGVKRDVSGLKVFLEENEVQVAFIDPLYLCLRSGGQAVSPANLYEVGPLLRGVGQACLDAGTTLLLVHHANKSAGNKAGRSDPLDLNDLAFSGIGEYVRQWLLLSRREPYRPGSGRHRLLMSVGGSAGQSGCWAVEVCEGVLDGDFGRREWRTTVSRPYGAD